MRDLKKEFNKLSKDLSKGMELPKDETALNKIHCELGNGKRIYWYYQDDLEFYENEGESVKDYSDALFSGIVIPIPYSSGTRESDYDCYIVVIDQYPTEKEDPTVDWIALNRLLDNPLIVEIYQSDNE